MRLSRSAIPWAVAGPAAFGLGSVVAARRTPGYVPGDQPISSLAAHGSPGASVMVPAFLGLAAGTFGLGRALRGSPLAPDPIPTMLTVAAVTTAGAGLARCSDPSCPTRGLDNGDPQLTDDLHALFSGATFLLWISTPFVAASRATDASPAARAASRAIGVGTIAMFAATGATARSDTRRGSGWAQRAFVATALAWHPLAALARRRT